MSRGLGRRLINRDYRLLWLAQAGSSFGEFLFSGTATVWVVTDMFPHSSELPTLVSMFVLAASIPRIFVAPVAGVFVDRWHVRRTMVMSDAVRTIFFALLFAAVVWGRLPLAAQYGAALATLILANVAAQFFNPARAALMQVIIPPERRVEAASTAMFALTGVAMAATALGPISFAVLGPALSIGVCIIAYLLSLAMTCLVGEYSDLIPKLDAPQHFWSEFAAGLSLMGRSRPLRVVFMGIVLYGISLGINNTALSLYGLKTLGLDARHYGLLSMMFPAGNLVAAIFGVRLVKRLGVHRIYLPSLIGLGLGYAVYGLCPLVPVAFAAMFGCGMVFSLYVLCQGPILQDATPVGFMGRIVSITAPATAIASALATLAVSQVLERLAHGAPRPGRLLDPYGTVIAIGAAFLLFGGLAISAAHRWGKPAPAEPESVAERSR